MGPGRIDPATPTAAARLTPAGQIVYPKEALA
jgi:hypothetical protein